MLFDFYQDNELLAERLALANWRRNRSLSSSKLYIEWLGSCLNHCWADPPKVVMKTRHFTPSEYWWSWPLFSNFRMCSSRSASPSYSYEKCLKLWGRRIHLYFSREGTSPVDDHLLLRTRCGMGRSNWSTPGRWGSLWLLTSAFFRTRCDLDCVCFFQLSYKFYHILLLFLQLCFLLFDHSFCWIFMVVSMIMTISHLIVLWCVVFYWPAVPNGFRFCDLNSLTFGMGFFFVLVLYHEHFSLALIRGRQHPMALTYVIFVQHQITFWQDLLHVGLHEIWYLDHRCSDRTASALLPACMVGTVLESSSLFLWVTPFCDGSPMFPPYVLQ